MGPDRRLRANTNRSQKRAALASAAAQLSRDPENPDLAAEVEDRRLEYRTVSLEEHILRELARKPKFRAEHLRRCAVIFDTAIASASDEEAAA